MPSTHEEDVRLADLVGPEANRQGGDVYLTQVLLIYEGTELNVELLERGAFFLCGTCGICGTGNRDPSQRFDDVVSIYPSLGGD